MPVVDDPGRVLVAGDVHGNAQWFAFLAVAARHYDCQAILQLGDFGYWPHVEPGRRFLDQVEAVCARTGVPVVWIDGNHENHDALRELIAVSPADGFVAVRPNVWHAPRGRRWTWRGRRFGALGGAFSLDWRVRTEGRNWWAGEVPTAADVGRLGDAGLDVLVTHDAPFHRTGPPTVALPEEDLAAARAVRDLLAGAVAQTRPALVLHGHWHRRHSLVHEGTAIEGYAADLQADERSFGILDVEELQVREPD